VNVRRRSVGWIAAGLLAGLALAVPLRAQSAPTNDDCLSCHGDASAVRENGTPVFVHPERFAGSAHAPFGCVDCHSDLATFTEFPHPERLARVDCAMCHDEPAQEYLTSSHAKPRAGTGAAVGATCADCHGGVHELLPRSHPESRANKLNIAETCATCHGDTTAITLPGGRSAAVAQTFIDSIHGQALERKGLVVAPTCSDCHNSHAVLPATSPDSPVFHANVPATCGTCHEGIRHEFADGAHGLALSGGNLEAPNCASCHTAHGIERTETTGWQLHAIEECGTCHNESLATYRDTFHGKVTALGFTPVAKCADCHGAHRIFGQADPRSMVAPANLVQTCAQCHPGANANFVKYSPHANKHDKARLPALYYTARFMQALLVFVFAFFGVHTAMWFSRGRAGARRTESRSVLKPVNRRTPPSDPGPPPGGAPRG
jgi:nitrate/TMAO reductase-like tetraheme cytochrome c subunit